MSVGKIRCDKEFLKIWKREVLKFMPMSAIVAALCLLNDGKYGAKLLSR